MAGFPRLLCLAIVCLLLTSCERTNPSGKPVKWFTDLEQAKREAAAERKDLLINFTGLEWCGDCIALEREVLATDEFSLAADHFVLVRLDYPSGVDRLPQEPPAPHVPWGEAYGVRSFPTVFLADQTGLPYAATGDMGVGPQQYLAQLEELRAVHAQRDAAFARAAAEQGIKQARSLAEGLDALKHGFASKDGGSNRTALLQFYRDQIDAVIKLDADNRAGLRDRFAQMVQARQQLDGLDELLDDVYEQQGVDRVLDRIDEILASTDSRELRSRCRRCRLFYLERADRYAEAAAYAREVADDPDCPADERHYMRSRLAWNLNRLGRVDEAIGVYDALVADVADDPDRAFSYMWDKAEMVLWRAGRYTDALETWDRALTLVKPDTTDWLDGQAWRVRILARLGRVDDAWAAYESAATSKVATPLDRTALMVQLANYLAQSGNRDAASVALAKARAMAQDLAGSCPPDDLARCQVVMDHASAVIQDLGGGTAARRTSP